MKMLRKIVVAIVIAVVVLSLVSFFLPGEVYVERSVRVAASKADVFRVLRNLRQFNEWNPWYKQDPEGSYILGGPEEGGPGSEIKWDTENGGQGRMIITREVPHDSIFIEMYFEEDYSSSAMTSFYLSEEHPDSVKVSWAFNFDVGLNPFYRYMCLFMNNVIASQYEVGLQDFKTLIESQPTEPDVAVELLELEEQQIIGLSDRFERFQDVGPSMERAYGALMERVAESVADTSYATMYIGAPNAEGGMDFLAGYLTTKDQPVPEGLISIPIAAGMYLSALHTGPYSSLSQTHDVLMQELNARGYTLIGNTWDHYLVPPSIEPDSMQLKTRIYYPVQVPQANQ